MRGVKYRYDIIDDKHLKLAPTKASWIAMILISMISFVPLLAFIIAGKPKVEFNLDDVVTDTDPDNPDTPPTTSNI